ncbi:PAC2 family protein [Natronoglycomyces albus]|uniref:PAC2 family protein n=2 Tax=Natronoglycomyces albus TaxID=2811108 RepID=A0A895XUI3_9ACTN|nr:PAC2 family protein [Natronoglycomyces albus]
MLLHLEGFMDAGSAGKGVVEALLEENDHQPVASFDVDQLMDYRSRRPNLTFSIDHWSDFDAPQLVVYLLRDAQGQPYLLLSGPEPDFAWERFVDAVEDLVDYFAISLVVGLQGIPMGVPHTRPLGLTVHATRPELVFDNRPVFSEMQVPGHAAGLLQFRLGQSGRDAIGLAAHVPHYLTQMSYPAASLRLIEAVAKATDLELPTSSLEMSREEVAEEIAQQVAENSEVEEIITTLEEQYDSFTEQAESDEMLADGRVPTAEELGAAFEHFLANQDRPDKE